MTNESNESSTTNGDIGFTRPDNWRDLLKQLSAIERALIVRERGGLAPRSAKATAAAVATFIVVCGATYVVRHLVGYPPIAFLSGAFCCAILTGCLSYHYGSAPRSHAEHLDRLLAAYTPAFAGAYSDLQEKTKAAGSLESNLVREWLGREHRSISRSSDDEMHRQYSFLSKR